MANSYLHTPAAIRHGAVIVQRSKSTVHLKRQDGPPPGAFPIGLKHPVTAGLLAWVFELGGSLEGNGPSSIYSPFSCRHCRVDPGVCSLSALCAQNIALRCNFPRQIAKTNLLDCSVGFVVFLLSQSLQSVPREIERERHQHGINFPALKRLLPPAATCSTSPTVKLATGDISQDPQ
ncbi:hypothetical protein P175DRAFT_0555681 [Aspergillus ochraceoroseus IBT 24754]|uniref:Uncharacterized protein n=1 Tax=Aspergillus ochraceoroseus IBT 24754 TaxID=1392256 RepID=A0A2T5M3B4_9EURO|nr:uncharacterized protein P175DRAFT_0555681 [Aspergillus ochraceoroseus IBT 24754]PTU23020.1 hypothetical protein P175DRAFT_0555681 [Aspergillus ochraceoroseus IBT 24754]